MDMRLSRLKIAKPDILKLFDNLPLRVLNRSDIDKILSQNRDFWRLSLSTTRKEFIDFMIGETKLKAAEFKFPYRTITRYTWGDVSAFETILSLKPNSYFTHYTAIYLHELTEQIPKTVYLNFEQPAKHRIAKDLSQQRIDVAFRRPWRISNNTSSYKDYKVCLLNGMFTGNLGVIDMVGPNGENSSVTNLERTLIDIAVRPVYSGGVFEVLKAYKLAYRKVSVNKLSAILAKLNYIYPYHQAIGFYLDKAGVYKDSQISLIQKFDTKYDFYLTHQMKDTDYSKKWRLFFPKGL
jgi:predicted transcriptional regulator of viral defense system